MNPTPSSQDITGAPKPVSPVSPKPLRFPNPASIGVLENQMDQAQNEAAQSMAASSFATFRQQQAQSELSDADTSMPDALMMDFKLEDDQMPTYFDTHDDHLTSVMVPGVTLPPRPSQGATESSYQNELDSFLHGLMPPFINAGAPGTDVVGPSRLSPPPVPTFQHTLAAPTTASAYRQSEVPQGKAREEEEVVWSAEIEHQFEQFLAEERVHVTQGEWEKFPANSRLFLGNLPSEKVSKRDIFHVFHTHGKLAQISIKQAYGFVQFFDAAACSSALEAQQGVGIRGRKIHLEISKPQRNTKDRTNGEGRAPRRRSRSPDRGGPSRADRSSRANHNGASRRQARDAVRPRDDYRPHRSPSPRSYRRRDRSSDKYSGRHRSRSHSPAGLRSGTGLENDLPFGNRRPQDIPEIQILGKGNLDRDFLTHIERQFNARGLRCDVYLVHPRLADDLVMKQVILEGVLAVMWVDYNSQLTHRFHVDMFVTQLNAEVEYQQYPDVVGLDTCVELVVRGKSQNQAAVAAISCRQSGSHATTQYGLPLVQSSIMPPPTNYPTYPPQQMQQNPVNNPNAFPTLNLDTAALQQLFGSLAQRPLSTNQSGYNAPPAAITMHPFGAQQVGPPQNPDLSRLFEPARIAHPVAPTDPTWTAHQPTIAPPPNAAAEDMSSIMARLATYKR